MKVLRPNSLPQEKFLASTADIVVYGGSAGSGKGTRKSCNVLTPFGFRRIGDLKEGDALCATDGTIQRIIGYYERGLQQFYRLRFADGSVVDCDEDHIWVAWRARGSFKRAGVQTCGESGAKKWTTKQIYQHFTEGSGCRLGIPIISKPAIFNVAGQKKGPNKFIKREIDPYTLGVMLGDGCITGKGKNPVSFFSNDKEIIARVSAIYPISLYKAGNRAGYNCVFKGKELENHLSDIGLLGTYSHTKFIPRIYLHGSVEERYDLLRGLMDTDGYVDSGGDLYYTTVSKRLAEDITFLVRSLGGFVSSWNKASGYKKEDGTYVPCKEAYNLLFKLPSNADACYLKRKRDRASKKRHQTLCNWIESIEKIDSDESVCISVSHPNSLFIVDNFIVTHNTYAVLFDTLRYVDDPNYRAVIFRRTSPMLTSPGGLWDTAGKVYTLPGIDGVAKQKDLMYTFPSGATVKFSHMEHVSDMLGWQGSQLTAVFFDEATHFDPSQITYMFSRLRSDAKADGYMRLTCNPDPDHKIRKWLDWWIDPKTGLPIPERSGVVRYFVMLGDEWYWASSKELLLRDPDVIKALADPDTGRVDSNLIMSFTFIPALLSDNKDLLRDNPRYKASLMAMPKVDRERLLGGNWNARASSGDYFNRKWCIEVDRNQIPQNMTRVRYWDRAGTKPNPVNENPDWTVGLLLGRCQDGYTWILDMVRFRDTPATVRSTIVATTDTDCALYPNTRVVVEKDPGQAGKSDAEMLVKALGGRDVRTRAVTKAKLTRFMPFSAAAEAGLVRVVRGVWNDDFYAELEAFSGDNKGKDDIVDCAAGGYLELEEKFNVPDFILPPVFAKPNSFSI